MRTTFSNCWKLQWAFSGPDYLTTKFSSAKARMADGKPLQYGNNVR